MTQGGIVCVSSQRQCWEGRDKEISHKILCCRSNYTNCLLTSQSSGITLFHFSWICSPFFQLQIVWFEFIALNELYNEEKLSLRQEGFDQQVSIRRTEESAARAEGAQAKKKENCKLSKSVIKVCRVWCSDNKTIICWKQGRLGMLLCSIISLSRSSVYMFLKSTLPLYIITFLLEWNFSLFIGRVDLSYIDVLMMI